MMMWYPKPVFASPYFGFPVELASRLNATSSNLGSRLPLDFQPRDPPRSMSVLFQTWGRRPEALRLCEQGRQEGCASDTPCLALSSENSLATSSNLVPACSFARASSFFECFSHCLSSVRGSEARRAEHDVRGCAAR